MDRKTDGGASVDDSEIFSRFAKIAKDRFSGATDTPRLDDLYNASSEFDKEKRLIEEISAVDLSKGIISGAACFALLRFSPNIMSRYLKRRGPPVGVTTGVNPFNHRAAPGFPPGPAAAGPGGSTVHQGGAAPSPRKPGLVLRAVRLGLDMFVSTSIAAYASLYFIDTPKLMRKTSEIPLVEGRSLLSEELCDDFAAEFRSYPRETWDEDHQSLQESSESGAQSKARPKLVSFIQEFVANCKRRDMYEEELRSERGMGTTEPVSVPHPGVPRSMEVTLDDLLSENGPGRSPSDSDDPFFNDDFESNDVDEGS